MTNATPTTTTHSPNNNSSTNNNNNNNGSSNNNGMNPTPLRVKTFPEHTEHARELAELATQEISLDLQGLITTHTSQSTQSTLENLPSWQHRRSPSTCRD